MTPLMMSNVLSIGPLEGGVADDDDDDGGLKAGVAPGKWRQKQIMSVGSSCISEDTRGRWCDTGMGKTL